MQLDKSIKNWIYLKCNNCRLARKGPNFLIFFGLFFFQYTLLFEPLFLKKVRNNFFRQKPYYYLLNFT